MSSNKSETAVHCCDPALSVLVMLVSRNIFHVVSALQSFAFLSMSYITGILLAIDFCLVYHLPEQFVKKISIANKISYIYRLLNV